MRTPIYLTFLTVPLPSSGFIVSSVRPRAETRLATTWSEYKHDYLPQYVDEMAKGTSDATTQQSQDSAAAAKAANAKAYWESKVREEKEKLQHMKSQEVVGRYSHPSPQDNWGHYKDALYALIPHKTHQNDSFHWPKHPSVASWSEYKHDYVDNLAKPPPDIEKVEEKKKKEGKRAIADAFWESKYKEDKEKLSRLNAEVVHPDIHTETWDHYKHDYIDSLPRQSTEAELEELRKEAAQFKALALAETVGLTLADEALHEAQNRAISCEIAEAVLLGAGIDKKPDAPSSDSPGHQDHDEPNLHLHV